MTPSKKYKWHNLPSEKVVVILNTDLKKGLGEKEVKRRQKKFGLNKLPEEKPLSRTKVFLSQFKSPLIYILVIAGLVTLILWEWTDTIVIFAAVFLNTIVGYLQEQKASNALRALKKVLKTRATVQREGKLKEVFREDLVPGDIIVLKTGEKVPADGRIIESFNLKISEAALTGEWLAAEKNPGVLPEKTPLADRDNMVYMGTIVEDGEGKAVITETGQRTEIGKIAKLVREQKEEKTPYQKKLAHFSKIIALLIALVCFLIFFFGILEGRNFIEMFTTAVAVAVAAIPEGLPVAMTVILALGMQRILKRKGLVRKLVAAETLGSTSVIATDKTLTLTQGKMKVEKIVSRNRNLTLKIATLCNEAFVENPQDPEIYWKIRGRPTDRALLLSGKEAGFDKYELEKELPKIDEIPFDKNGKILFVSGAPEKIIELSKIDEKNREKLNNELENLTAQGLRVIAVGYKKIALGSENKIFKKISGKLVNIRDLSFSGFIGLKDPLRKEAKRAIQLCKRAGLRPILVTGDHLLTAKGRERVGSSSKRGEYN